MTPAWRNWHEEYPNRKRVRRLTAPNVFGIWAHTVRCPRRLAYFDVLNYWNVNGATLVDVEPPTVPEEPKTDA